MKRPKQGTKRIMIAINTAFVIFGLASGFTGTMAWFLSTRTYESEAAHFEVKNLEMSIDSVTLYKFNYPSDGFGGLDYLMPQDGWVGEYQYDGAPKRQCFGETVYDEETGQNVWRPVTTMNLYDPLNGTITGRGLIGMNCNAIFKIDLYSESIESIDVRVCASILPNPEKEDDEIWLSSCVDFDVFLPSDLTDPRLVTDGYKNYLPNESTDYLPQDYVFEHSYEEDYYKISYLSSLKTGHAHLYADEHQEALSDVDIGRPSITFSEGHATVYVNVNYAPSELKQYEETVTPEDSIRAVYDYLLRVC